MAERRQTLNGRYLVNLCINMQYMNMPILPRLSWDAGVAFFWFAPGTFWLTMPLRHARILLFNHCIFNNVKYKLYFNSRIFASNQYTHFTILIGSCSRQPSISAHIFGTSSWPRTPRPFALITNATNSLRTADCLAESFIHKTHKGKHSSAKIHSTVICR